MSKVGSKGSTVVRWLSALLCDHRLSFAAPAFQPLATDLFQSPHPGCGTLAEERHVGTITDCFMQQTPQDSLLQSYLPSVSCSSRTVTLVISDTVIVTFAYLLTLTYSEKSWFGLENVQSDVHAYNHYYHCFAVSSVMFAWTVTFDLRRSCLVRFFLICAGWKLHFCVVIGQVFSAHYCSSNHEAVLQFVKGADTVLLLAFATILLNTDLHNDCIRPEHKMTLQQFVHNLRGSSSLWPWNDLVTVSLQWQPSQWAYV